MSLKTLNSMTKAELIAIISERNDETQAQRLRISVLEGELALRPRATAAQSQGVAPVVTKYQDFLGRVWIKTRVGNRATSVLAS